MFRLCQFITHIIACLILSAANDVFNITRSSASATIAKLKIRLDIRTGRHNAIMSVYMIRANRNDSIFLQLS